jgi:hypothetical protein
VSFAAAIEAAVALAMRIRDAGVAVLPFEDFEWRGQAPSAPFLRAIADDRRKIVQEDARQGRHIADVAARRPREVEQQRCGLHDRFTSTRNGQSHGTNVRVGSLCDRRLVACGV